MRCQSPFDLALQLAIVGRIQEREMKTMTRVSAVESPVAALQDMDGGSGEEQVYEGVRPIGPDIDKLVSL